MSKTPNNKPNNNVHPVAVIAVIIGFLLLLGWYIIRLRNPPFVQQINESNQETLKNNPQLK